MLVDPSSSRLHPPVRAKDAIFLESYIPAWQCPDVVESARIFAAVAEPSRRRILELLCRRPMLVSELVAQVGLSQPATSKHLRVLRDSDLVRVRVDGPRRVYQLRPEGLKQIDQWLTPYRRLWAASLDRLERELDRTQRKKR